MDVKIIIKNKGNLLANADLFIKTEMYGCITIKGFQIWKSDVFNRRLRERINVAPLSRRYYGRYVKLVFFEEEKQWEKVEKEIYKAYKDFVSLSDINLDDMDKNED